MRRPHTVYICILVALYFAAFHVADAGYWRLGMGMLSVSFLMLACLFVWRLPP